MSSQTAIFDIEPAQSYVFRVAAATSKGTGIYSSELRIDAQQGGVFFYLKMTKKQFKIIGSKKERVYANWK